VPVTKALRILSKSHSCCLSGRYYWRAMTNQSKQSAA
jgi:hypothetical protein